MLGDMTQCVSISVSFSPTKTVMNVMKQQNWLWWL